MTEETQRRMLDQLVEELNSVQNHMHQMVIDFGRMRMALDRAKETLGSMRLAPDDSVRQRAKEALEEVDRIWKGGTI